MCLIMMNADQAAPIRREHLAPSSSPMTERSFTSPPPIIFRAASIPRQSHGSRNPARPSATGGRTCGKNRQTVRMRDNSVPVRPQRINEFGILLVFRSQKAQAQAKGPDSWEDSFADRDESRWKRRAEKQEKPGKPEETESRV